MKKRFISIILPCVMVLPLTLFPASGASTSGKCGDNVMWNFDQSNGSLTISGTGPMWDYTNVLKLTNNYEPEISSNAPGWYTFQEYIKQIVVSSGVTHIGNHAFQAEPDMDWFGDSYPPYNGFSKLTAVNLADSVTSIGTGAFAHCNALSNVSFGNGLTIIDDFAFSCCWNLKQVTLPSSLTAIGANAFRGTSLTSVMIPKSVKTIGSEAFGYRGWEIDYGFLPVNGFTIYGQTGTAAESYYNNLLSKYNQCKQDSYLVYYYPEDFGPNGTVYFVTNIDGFKHIIYSAGENGKDSQFEFKENEELEDLVYETKSTTYNPRLAHFTCEMARSAYNQTLLKENLNELGFDTSQNSADYKEDYRDNLTAAYSIAKKKLEDNSTLVMVTIRGSSGWSWANNADIGFNALNGFGKHEGFERNATEIYNALISLCNGIPKENTTIVITGHSQGGAAGNLLAVKLYDQGVPASNVYCYNYACPNVACLLNPLDWNPRGIHDNIFNIGNVEDPVTFIPSTLLGAFIPKLSPLSTWGKFGQTYWFFPNEENHSAAGHDMKHYVYALSFEYPISAFATYQQLSTEYIMRVLGIHCPVDAAVYDNSGNLVAGVKDNEPYYTTGEESVFVIVNGDEKWILLPVDQTYDIRLTATDTGEMNYEIYNLDLTSGEIADEKSFDSVSLSERKEMRCSVGGTAENKDARLFVVDSQGNATAQIQEDGTELIIQDEPSNWAKAEIELAIKAGLVPDTLQKNYKQPISRRDVAQMFINLIEKSSGKTIDTLMKEKGVSINSGAFVDTTDSAVLAAHALGIIQGIGNNKFDPQGTLTRAQIAAIINRIANVLEVRTEGYTHNFTDVVGHWVDGELGWPVHAKIIEGVGNNKFDPNGKLTTEQAIAITYRAFQALK